MLVEARPDHASQPVTIPAIPRQELAAAVRDAVQSALGEGDATLWRIARRLGLGARTLQRRLEEENLMFREIVDEVRRAQALVLIDTALSLDEVTVKLGYSEARAFRRAFRRWTGRCPMEHRRAARKA